MGCMSFQKVGPFEIFGWSVAGNETCVAVTLDLLLFMRLIPYVQIFYRLNY
uniref:Nuclear ribonuclease Z n=1 Tax=Schistosoma japonicum TaxID=6182 RepID=C1LHT8_SCHJA|nr:Nuclear ribonuclease Z [Schistosoma japonicum]